MSLYSKNPQTDKIFQTRLTENIKRKQESQEKLLHTKTGEMENNMD